MQSYKMKIVQYCRMLRKLAILYDIGPIILLPFYLFTFYLLLFCFYELVILCCAEQEAACAVVLEIRNGGEGDRLAS